MPTIVKHYDKKTGRTRVFESTPHYDPVTKQSRPKRKYLGTLDSETGELIPSSGRRGRTSSSGKTSTAEGSVTPSMVDDLRKRLSAKEAEAASLRSEVEALKNTVRLYKEACEAISDTLRKVLGRP